MLLRRQFSNPKFPHAFFLYALLDEGFRGLAAEGSEPSFRTRSAATLLAWVTRIAVLASPILRPPRAALLGHTIKPTTGIGRRTCILCVPCASPLDPVLLS